MSKESKPKKCKACGAEFRPARPLQRACSLKCAIELGQQAVKRKDRRERRERLVAIRSRRDWARLAQSTFNAYIRARDYGKGCVSCGRSTGAKINAGHYRTVGAAPQLRFDESNCHAQCEHCNRYKSGNLVEYRVRLVERIGSSELERLESDNGIRRFTIDELKAVIATYKAKLKSVRLAPHGAICIQD